jgi:acyl carrier protein
MRCNRERYPKRPNGDRFYGRGNALAGSNPALSAEHRRIGCTRNVVEAIDVADSGLPTRTSTIQWLESLPRSERRDALESFVVAEFKSTLLMTADDELPREQSFFDLGLTSLGLTEVKQRLDTLLGRAISTNSLFNQPTMAALITQLCDEVPAQNRAPTSDLAAAADTALVDDLLQQLYRV